MDRSKRNFEISVIISTYNSPIALTKTLWGFRYQTFANFELVIADDGSTSETADVIRQFQALGLNIVHIWHEDRGFRKNRILNRAIEATAAPYLVFTDGDCIPRSDFIETHLRIRKPNHFLNAGGCIRVPQAIHEGLTQNDVMMGYAFEPKWLKQHGFTYRSHLFRLSVTDRWKPIINLLSHRPGVFTGNGSSVWRTDVIRVNGYDERVAYGGTDREFGYRLVAAGVKTINARYSLISLHLEHDRPYQSATVYEFNKDLMRRNRRNKIHWTDHGILQDNPPEAEVQPASKPADTGRAA